MAICDPYGGDVGAAMATLGYEPWCQVSADGVPTMPLTLALYSRDTPPLQFLLQLEGNAGNVVEHVFAETLPDAMELLAKWVPIAQAGALIGLAGRRAATDIDAPEDTRPAPAHGIVDPVGIGGSPVDRRIVT
jgi:hypothetical protein